MVTDERKISIVPDKKLITEKRFSFISMVGTYLSSFLRDYTYIVGDPAFEFIVQSYEDNKVTFKSRKFANSFLSVNQSGEVSIQKMSPYSSEAQFAVRVQVHAYDTGILQRYNCVYIQCMLKPQYTCR